MEAIYSELTKEENLHLLDAIPLITLLIGFADGHLDTYETEWAARVVKFRSFTNDEDLKDYYVAVGATFEARLNHFIRIMSKNDAERMQFLSDEIAKMNPILAKLNTHDGYRLYHDFLSFAKHVAKSSGGVFYMANVSPREKSLMNLDMLNPVTVYRGL